MAVTTISNWIPVIKEQMVAGKDALDSAVYTVARRRVTSTAQTDVPRLVEADVGGGSSLTDDSNATTDVVSMHDFLYNGKRPLDEAEFEDAPQDTLDAAASAWLHSFNKRYDNACIGVTAARSGTASNKQPYTSIYKAVTTTDNSGAITYTANDNLVQGASGGLTYANVSSGLSKVENEEFWDPARGIVIMHPGLMDVLRTMTDGSNRYIFQESTAGFPGGTATNPNMPGYKLFNLPVIFTHGAKTSSSFAMAESGNRLLVYANRDYLVRGDRIPVQSRFIPASINTSALQHTMQFRARQGFVVTIPHAVSVVEDTSS